MVQLGGHSDARESSLHGLDVIEIAHLHVGKDELRGCVLLVCDAPVQARLLRRGIVDEGVDDEQDDVHRQRSRSGLSRRSRLETL